MGIPMLAGPALLAALLGGAGANAQIAAPVTDVAAPAAEERDSAGALVLPNSPVPAQRSKALGQPPSSAGAVGRGVLRATNRAQTKAEVTKARAAEAADLRQQGAGSLTGK